MELTGKQIYDANGEAAGELVIEALEALQGIWDRDVLTQCIDNLEAARDLLDMELEEEE